MKKILYYSLFLLLCSSIYSCDDDTPENIIKVPITIVTNEVTNIENTNATSGGVITSTGAPKIEARGVCWSTSENPTIQDARTIDGSVLGEFSSQLAGLSLNEKYYVRAYVTTAFGTTYGESVSFIAGKTPPSLTTIEATDITNNTAVSGGKILKTGTTNITSVGICWSKSPRPTIDDENTIDDLNENTFNSQLIYLDPGTTYYVRAYAINEGGPGYGNEVVITTKGEGAIVIADPAFKAYCVQNFDTNGDGQIQDSEADRIISVDCQGYGTITSLEGIKSFKNLRELRCNGNSIAKLDVAGMTNLEVLWTFRNNMTELNVTGCESLQYLHCYENSLASLDISTNPKLKEFDARANQLTSTTFDNNKELVTLSLIGNKIQEINVSNTTTLTKLWCDGGQVTKLNVSGCTALDELYCQDNKLTSLNISGCTSLRILWAFRNSGLTSVDASGCKALERLETYECQLTNLKLTECSKLKFINANANKLTAINITDCVSLEEMHCNENQLASVNFAANKSIKVLGLIRNRISTIDLSGNKSITGIWCDGGQTQSINVSNCSNLVNLYCQENQITSINTAGCTSLTTMWSYFNAGLTSINVSDSPNLSVLYTWGCSLSSLTLPSVSKLVDLRCQENKLTSLAVHSANLLELHCQNNLFTALNVAGCSKLNVLFGFNNANLPTLDISECPLTMAIVELNGCTSLSTLTMKTGQNVTDSFKIPSTTTIVRK